jgi:hypothetical protein
MRRRLQKGPKVNLNSTAIVSFRNLTANPIQYTMDTYPSCSCLRIDPVKPVLAVMHSDAIHSRHRRTELDGNRLLPEYTSSIRFRTMMDDYCKVSMAFKGRWSGSCPASISNWSIYKIFKWVKLRSFVLTFRDNNVLNSIAVTSFRKILIRTASL